jgi:hypothetical protein
MRKPAAPCSTESAPLEARLKQIGVLLSRSLSDIDRSTAANELQPSASFSALKNPQRIPVNTPPVFPSLAPLIWL